MGLWALVLVSVGGTGLLFRCLACGSDILRSHAELMIARAVYGHVGTRDDGRHATCRHCPAESALNPIGSPTRQVVLAAAAASKTSYRLAAGTST